MGSCLSSFCPRINLGLRKTGDENQCDSKDSITQDSASFMLVDFSGDVDRRLVRFQPPVPKLPRCSLCGMVPSRLYRGDICKHVLCTSCCGQSASVCPFDGTNMVSTEPDTTPAAMVSECLVHCWNHTEGCSYLGCILEMPLHYRTCPHFVICCASCGEKVKMMNLVSHTANNCSAIVLADLKAPTSPSKSPGANFRDLESINRTPTQSGTAADFVWTVGPYSKLAYGIHHFMSTPFYTRSGREVQLLGSIDGISTVELKVAVHFLPTTSGASLAKLPESYTFRLLKKDSWCGGSVGATYPVEEFLNPLKTPTSRLIARIDKTVFKEKFLTNDTFVVEFSALP